MDKTICVLGLGYIGLPTAALLANRGYRVTGVDVVPAVVETINRGDVHIAEPNLDTFVRAAVGSGRLRAALSPDPADVYIIAVPTPITEGRMPDLRHVEAAVGSIARYIQPGNFVILESTSPVGTTERVERLLKSAGVDTAAIHVAHCPERVLPGNVIAELTQNDRVVGGLTSAATRAVADFYRSFVNGEVLETDSRTAELTKLVENSSRDVQLAFANELSMLCDRHGIDVWEILRLANRHPRVKILNPGPGVGGHCIAVDPWFIVASAPEESVLIRTARQRNLDKAVWTLERIVKAADALRSARGKPPLIACMGLSYKPNVDDMRESPALQICRALIARGLSVVAVEPHIRESKDLPLVDAETALSSADMLVFLVGHTAFKSLQIGDRPVLDFCGITMK